MARKIQEQQDEESLRQETVYHKPPAKPYVKPYAKNTGFYLPPIICPYTSCGLRFEAWDFHTHAAAFHQTNPQIYACPICSLGSDVFYTVNDKTNLLLHLKNHHADTAPGVMAPVFTAKPAVLPYSGEDNIDLSSDTDSDEEIYVPPVKNPPLPKLPNNVKYPGTSHFVKYQETTLTKNLQMECTICFEPFISGQIIVTIECLCVYHKICINNWWKKKNTCTCPLHIRD